MMAPSIDPEVLEGLRSLVSDDDPNFLNQYLHVFLSSIPPRLIAIDAAIKAKDSKKLFMEAHAMKSSCASTGAILMTALTTQLEQLGKVSNTTEGAAELLQKLTAEFAVVKAEIQSLPEYKQ